MSTTACRQLRGPRTQSGISLLEVLVSVIVLSVGLLGVAGLQLSGLQYTQAAYQRSQATAVTASLIERMRSNREGVADGEYDGLSVTANQSGLTTHDCSVTAGCSPAEIADRDIEAWTTTSLPRLGGSAAASVSRNGNVFTINVAWADVSERDSSGDAVQRNMTTEVRIQ
jgi:type IV pilus assembly protein PilV